MVFTPKKVELSVQERRLLALLPADGAPISTLQLVEAAYPKLGKRPFNARQSIVARMASIEAKLAAQKATQRVARTKRNGPHPIQFMLVTK